MTNDRTSDAGFALNRRARFRPAWASGLQREGAPDAVERGLGYRPSRGLLVQLTGETIRVPRGHDAAEDGDAERSADLSGGVVDRRPDTGLVLGQ
jgi:hypothetical protein